MSTMIISMKLEEQKLETLRNQSVGWDIIQGNAKELTPEQLQAAEIIVGWNPAFNEHCLIPGTRLRWVQNWGAGVDKMPLTLFAQYGVILTTTSGIHAIPISENVYAMMLSLVRKIHIAIRNQSQSKWTSVGTTTEIHGKTLGIIGVGEIGKEIARIGKAFGMTVLGFRSSGQPVEHVDHMYTTSQLDELLAASDFVVNTLPLTTKTRHMIGQQQFSRMKPSAYYFNIGRGATTDEAAMYEALQDGTIAGAGIDVFEQEPLPSNSPLWALDNIIITPHNSGATTMYNSRAMEIFKSNLIEYLQGSKPSWNFIDIAQQY